MMATGASVMTSLLSAAAQATGIAAVMGYISLRSHLSYLGVSSLYSLGIERYLMETYFFAEVVVRILIWAALGFVVIWIALLIRSSIGGTFSTMRLTLKRLGVTNARSLLPWYGPAFLLMCVALLAKAASGESDVIVGDLSKQLAPRNKLWFDAAVLIGLVWFLVIFDSRIVQEGRAVLFPKGIAENLIAVLVGGISVSLLLAIPLIYGREAHPVEFPLARITLKEAAQPELCGLVLLQTNDEIAVWFSRTAYGRVVAIPMSNVQKLEFGHVRNALNSVVFARGAGATYPTCTEQFP